MAQSEGSIFDPHKTCGASAQEAKENGVRAQGHSGGGAFAQNAEGERIEVQGIGGGGGGRQILVTSSRLNSIDVISNGSGGTLPVDPS